MTARISARARDDLYYIYAYSCARYGNDAADDLLTRIKEAIEFLAAHPEAGPHPPWATRYDALRFWVIRKTRFLVFYFPDASDISIERVLDGRRDVKRIIQDGLEEPPPEDQDD